MGTLGKSSIGGEGEGVAGEHRAGRDGIAGEGEGGGV